ncbi:MAG: hypothetical protein DRJ35_02300 [Thermoprotei archaeon]|nr:MAG: hypothetical protein DRJ35_02300 [Thermoprotei archaeon]
MRKRKQQSKIQRFRLGFSPIVSTVILTGILLTIIGVAIFYASSLIDANRQQMEFESSKDLLIYTATALEQVALGTGGSRYVRFSLSTTGIDFINNAFGELNVSVNDVEIFHDEETSAIIIEGGPLVTNTFRMLRPEIKVNPEAEINKLIIGAGEPLIIVYENFSGGAIAVLRATRIRVNYLGVFDVLEAGIPKKYNYFAIYYINITFGSLGGSGNIPVILRNKGITTREYKFNSNVIHVEANLDGIDETKDYIGDITAQGSVIIVRIAQVEVSTGG